MMSLETIRRMSDEVAQEAARRGKKPYVPFNVEEVLGWSKRCPVPNIGSFQPKGWKRTDQEWFVDSSGCGSSNEPALTAENFARQVSEYAETHPTHGYAIVEEGPFQLYIAAFAPKKGKAKKVRV